MKIRLLALVLLCLSLFCPSAHAREKGEGWTPGGVEKAALRASREFEPTLGRCSLGFIRLDASGCRLAVVFENGLAYARNIDRKRVHFAIGEAVLDAYRKYAGDPARDRPLIVVSVYTRVLAADGGPARNILGEDITQWWESAVYDPATNDFRYLLPGL